MVTKEVLEKAKDFDFSMFLDKNGNLKYTANQEVKLLWFLHKAYISHGDKYDYSLVSFTKSSDNIEIICPDHGVFEANVNKHHKSKGCRKCYNESRRDTLENVRCKYKERFGDKYIIPDQIYIDAHHKMKLICDKHGDFFLSANTFLGGVGCAKCSGREKLTIKDVITKAKEVHGNRYEVPDQPYVNKHTDIKIICKIHGEFTMSSNNFLRGQNCPTCSQQNHDVLYLLYCPDTDTHKIGISINNPKVRSKRISKSMEIVYYINCKHPRKYENFLHNKYKSCNVYNNVVRCGNTEFFKLTQEDVQDVINYMNSIVDKENRQFNELKYFEINK